MNFKELYNYDELLVKDFFNKYHYPFECLNDINNFIIELGNSLSKDDFKCFNENIWIHKTAKVSNKAILSGPLIIMDNVTIRPNAYIRGNVFIGSNSVIGNSSEIKNSVLLNNVQVPHFNYVGDSILGNFVHLGAGAIISNLKSDKSNVKIDGIDTKLRKVGAFIGDNVEIGCNSVICPGTIIKKNTTIYPLVMVRGIIDENKIVKNENVIVDREIS